MDKNVARIIIEFDGKKIKTSYPPDQILSLGMLDICRAEIFRSLSVQKTEQSKIIKLPPGSNILDPRKKN